MYFHKFKYKYPLRFNMYIAYLLSFRSVELLENAQKNHIKINRVCKTYRKSIRLSL